MSISPLQKAGGLNVFYNHCESVYTYQLSGQIFTKNQTSAGWYSNISSQSACQFLKISNIYPVFARMCERRRAVDAMKMNAELALYGKPGNQISKDMCVRPGFI